MVNHLSVSLGQFRVRVFHEEVGITMRRRIAVGTSLTIMLLAGSLLAADALKSGPQVGQTPVPFNPDNITGQFAGTKQCLV